MSWLLKAYTQPERQSEVIRKDDDGSLLSAALPSNSSLNVISLSGQAAGKQEERQTISNNDFLSKKRSSSLFTSSSDAQSEPANKRNSVSRVGSGNSSLNVISLSGQPSGKQEERQKTSDHDFLSKKRSSSMFTSSSDDQSEPANKRNSVSRVGSGRARLDETQLSPRHRKRLEKGRRWQERQRTARKVADDYPDDKALQEMLMSGEGERMFPETSALLRRNKAEAAAANAVKSVLESMPARAAHKQKMVGRMRGLMTSQEWNDFRVSINNKYAAKAARVERQLEERAAKGEAVPVDVFNQKRAAEEQREGISVLEKSITKKVVLEAMGHKSGRETLYWYGNLDSFHHNYTDTLFKTIFKQMVLSAGSVEALVVELKATKWVSANAAAYTCGGMCGRECRHFYQPRTRKTFNKILADQKVSFMCITKTVPCKWHDNYDKWCAELKREEAKTGAARKPKKILQLKQNKNKCEIHFRQYETQRSFVQARIDGLEAGSGQWVIYQDYLAWYSENGTKINDLLFTLVQRDSHGQLKYEYLHNFMLCEHSEATTRYTWAYHFRSKKDGGSGELSSLPGPGVRTGDGGGDFTSRAFIYSESCYHSLYGVDVEAHVLCPNHAWNPCDGAKRNLTRVFTKDQVEQGRGFSLVSDWLESASNAGYSNVRLYGHEMDVIMAWADKNQIKLRGISGWQFPSLRSFKYSQDTDAGRVFSLPGVAYGAYTSDVRDAQRVVLDMRHDDVAGLRCEFCTQATKSPQPAHGKGKTCPNRRGGVTGVESGFVLEQSDATAGMEREEKIKYFRNLKAKQRVKKKRAKGKYSSVPKAQCVTLLEAMGLPTEGKVAELRARLDEATSHDEPKAKGRKGGKRGRGKGEKDIDASPPAVKKRKTGSEGSRRKRGEGTDTVAKERRQVQARGKRVDYSGMDEDGEEEEKASAGEWECDICGVRNRKRLYFVGCEDCGAVPENDDRDASDEEGDEDEDNGE